MILINLALLLYVHFLFSHWFYYCNVIISFVLLNCSVEEFNYFSVAPFHPKVQFENVFFHYIHIRKIKDPWGGANFDPRAFIWTNLVDIHQKMFHAKYLSSSLQEDFLRFLENHFWSVFNKNKHGVFSTLISDVTSSCV